MNSKNFKQLNGLNNKEMKVRKRKNEKQKRLRKKFLSYHLNLDDTRLDYSKLSTKNEQELICSFRTEMDNDLHNLDDEDLKLKNSIKEENLKKDLNDNLIDHLLNSEDVDCIDCITELDILEAADHSLSNLESIGNLVENIDNLKEANRDQSNLEDLLKKEEANFYEEMLIKNENSFVDAHLVLNNNIMFNEQANDFQVNLSKQIEEDKTNFNSYTNEFNCNDGLELSKSIDEKLIEFNKFNIISSTSFNQINCSALQSNTGNLPNLCNDLNVECNFEMNINNESNDENNDLNNLIDYNEELSELSVPDNLQLNETLLNALLTKQVSNQNSLLRKKVSSSSALNSITNRLSNGENEDCFSKLNQQNLIFIKNTNLAISNGDEFNLQETNLDHSKTLINKLDKNLAIQTNSLTTTTSSSNCLNSLYTLANNINQFSSSIMNHQTLNLNSNLSTSIKNDDADKNRRIANLTNLKANLNSNLSMKLKSSCNPFSASCRIPLPGTTASDQNMYIDNRNFIKRRNQRERIRVKSVNEGFDRLRKHLPIDYEQYLDQNCLNHSQNSNHSNNEQNEIYSKDNYSNASNKERRLSKVETLRLAVNYIKFLSSLLNDSDNI